MWSPLTLGAGFPETLATKVASEPSISLKFFSFCSIFGAVDSPTGTSPVPGSATRRFSNEDTLKPCNGQTVQGQTQVKNATIYIIFHFY